MNNKKNKSKLNLFKMLEKTKKQKKLQKQKEILLSSINSQNINEKEILKFEEDFLNNSFNSNSPKNKLTNNNNNNININIIINKNKKLQKENKFNFEDIKTFKNKNTK